MFTLPLCITHFGLPCTLAQLSGSIYAFNWNNRKASQWQRQTDVGVQLQKYRIDNHDFQLAIMESTGSGGSVARVSWLPLCGASPSQTQPAGGNQECRGSSDEEHGSSSWLTLFHTWWWANQPTLILCWMDNWCLVTVDIPRLDGCMGLFSWAQYNIFISWHGFYESSPVIFCNSVFTIWVSVNWIHLLK